jgi:peptidoglycan/LPS O-acetylase OafA/YrhL
LFPAMLFCSLFVYLTLEIFAKRPGGSDIPFRYLLPGLTFVGPEWWSLMLHQRVFNLEEPFWSLYIEAKFYVLFSILYFALGWKKAISGLLFIFMASVLFQDFSWLLGTQRGSWWASLGWNVTYLVDGKAFGWFCAGALFFKYSQIQKSRWIYAGLGVAVLSAITRGGFVNIGYKRWALFVVLLFVLPLASQKVSALLSKRALVFLGFISYPLYLLHEGMMVSMIADLGRIAPWIPAFLLPLFPMVICVGLSWSVARYAEPWTRQCLRNGFRMGSAVCTRICKRVQGTTASEEESMRNS